MDLHCKNKNFSEESRYFRLAILFCFCDNLRDEFQGLLEQDLCKPFKDKQFCEYVVNLNSAVNFFPLRDWLLMKN